MRRWIWRVVLGLVVAGVALGIALTWMNESANEAATREGLWRKLSSGDGYGHTDEGYASLKDCLGRSKTQNTVPFCMEIDQAVERAVK